MIYECTDCEHCADFVGGFRIFCMAKGLPPEEVCNYQFLGERDAEECPEFRHGPSQWFGNGQLDEALDTPDETGQTQTYAGVRLWVERHRGLI